ncbi:MAG: TetR/AcrR family transcriptional regulator [Bacteroidia bacterium]|nr:TetR/AcrR family transcriptional regulator [Bacteroidia bacterium]
MKNEEEKANIEEKEKVRQDIVQSAQDVFKVYGWKKTSIEDIARKAGKGKSTLYHYFKNKEEIFFAVLMMEVEHVWEKLEKAIYRAGGFEAKLRSFFHVELREIFNTTNLYSSFCDYWVDNFMQIEERIACSHRDQNMALLIAIIKQGIQEGRVEERTEAELEKIAETLIQARMGFLIELARTTQEADFEVIEKHMKIFLDLIIRGLIKR